MNTELQGGKPERPSPLKSACRLPLFHLPFLPFCKREKRSTERSLESRGEAFGRMSAVVRGCYQYFNILKYIDINLTKSFRFPREYPKK